MSPRSASFAFWILVAVHLVPIWAAHWYVTLDGPCHLYNARLLLELVRGDAFIGTFFAINTFPEPYWAGQVVMALGFTILPGWLVEKLVFSLIIIGTAATFRSVARTLAPDRPWSALLGMPFLLHYGVAMGFINFCLSLPLCLYLIDTTLRSLRSGYHSSIKLLLLFTLLYFTHPVTFLATVAVTGLLAVPPRQNGMLRSAGWRTFRIIAFAALPGGVMLAWYIVHHTTARGATVRLPMATLISYIVEGRAFNGLGVPGELLLSSACAIVLIGLGLFSWVAAFRSERRTWDPWAILSASALAAYLVIPDVLAGGSSTSPRVLLFLMLIVALWVVATPLFRWPMAAGLFVMVIADAGHTVIQARNAVALSNAVEDLTSATDPLPRNSVVLPLNYSDNWMHSNISTYVGVERGSIILDNFVATAPFAPVRWRPEMLPYGTIGTFAHTIRPCVRLDAYTPRSDIEVGYVLLWMMPEGDGDSCTVDVRTQLQNTFTRNGRSASGNAVLEQRRSR